MAGGFFTKNKKKHPITGRRRVASAGSSQENEARTKTLRQMNYQGGDYVGPNPSRRSIQLDRARKSKQSHEVRYRKSKRRR